MKRADTQSRRFSGMSHGRGSIEIDHVFSAWYRVGLSSVAITSVTVVPVAVAIAVACHPVVDLCGKILQLAGLDPEHHFLFFRCQAEAVVKVTCVYGPSRISEQHVTEPNVHSGGAE